MKKRIRASAIIMYNEKLITIYREKMIDGRIKKYYVIPGGGVEESESILDAIKREILEEVGIEIDIMDEFFFLEKEDAKEYFYVANYVSGIIGTGTGPEFTNRNVKKYGTYKVKLIPKEEIYKINLLPPEVKEYIICNFI